MKQKYNSEIEAMRDFYEKYITPKLFKYELLK